MLRKGGKGVKAGQGAQKPQSSLKVPRDKLAQDKRILESPSRTAPTSVAGQHE